MNLQETYLELLNEGAVHILGASKRGDRAIISETLVFKNKVLEFLDFEELEFSFEEIIAVVEANHEEKKKQVENFLKMGCLKADTEKEIYEQIQIR